MHVNPYTFPREYRSCLNCVHLDQPATVFCGKTYGGCRERLLKFGMKKEDLGKTYCGQWYLQQLKEEY